MSAVAERPGGGWGLWRRKWVRGLAGLVAGGGVGYGFGYLVGSDDWFGPALDGMSHPQELVLLLGVVIGMLAPMMVLMSFVKPMYDAERSTDEPIDMAEFRAAQGQLRLSALAMLAMAVELFAIGWPVAEGSGPQGARLGLVAAMLAVQFACSWVLWRRYDELQRQVVLEGSTISFMLGLVVFTLWAALAQLGYGVPFDPVAAIGLMTVIGMAPTLVLSVRRGLSK